MPTKQTIKTIKKISRETNKLPKGGFHSTKKGDKGYKRKPKHPHREER